MSRCLISRSAASLSVLMAIFLWTGCGGAGEEAGSPSRDASGEPVETRTIAGIVVDENGQPQPDVSVWLAESDGAGYDRWQQQTTDEHGRFQFAGSATRSIQLTAIGKGPRFGVVGRRFQPGQPLTRLAVLLPRQTGTLTLKVTDLRGAPIAGAIPEWVSWVPPEASRVWLQAEVFKRAGLEVPTSDQEGLLRLPGLAQGAETNVGIRHPDFAGREIEGARVGEDLARTIRLDAGGVLTVQAIRAEDEAPVSDATVTVYAGEMIAIKEPVDANGLYSVRLPIGKGALVRVEHETLEARELPRSSSSRNDLSDIDASRSAQPRRPLRVLMYPTGTIAGQVFDRESGEPISDLLVKATSDADHPKSWNGRTDENGRYEITAAAGPVKMDIYDGVGYEPLDQEAIPANVDAGETANADDLFVRRLPKVRGIVKTADGEPVTGREAIVMVGAFRTTPLRVDDQGRFEYQLQRKSEFVTIEAMHLTQSASGSASLNSAEVEQGTEAVITLQETATVRGQVVDSNDHPIAGVSVRLMVGRKAGDFRRWTYSAPTVTDEDGRFEFPGVERGVSCVPALWTDSEPLTAPTPIDDADITFDRIVVPTEQAIKILRPQNAKAQAPMLACDDWINTMPLDLAALRGQVVLLDFWGTWCGPCVAELPNIQELHELYGQRGLTVIAVHDNSTPTEMIREFLDARELTFPVAVDNANGTTHGRYNVNAWPTKVLIDRQGRIVAPKISGTSELWKLVREQVLDH